MNDFQENYNVFQSAPEIPEPWYVFHHELAKKERTLHIYIEYRSGAEFSCPNCGNTNCKVHDILDQDRTWRHLDIERFFMLECPELNVNRAVKYAPLKLIGRGQVQGFPYFLNTTQCR